MTMTLNPLYVFDLETTSADPETARIVTFAAGPIYRGKDITDVRTGIVNPGVPIEEQATAVHGVSNEIAEMEGMHPRVAIEVILDSFSDAVAAGAFVVAYNARFDFTILERETRRHLDDSADSLLSRVHVIDPLVIDKVVDKYRRGTRRLGPTCQHYGIALDGWHEAEADAVAAGMLTWALTERYPKMFQDLGTLHGRQVTAAAEQARSFQHYLRTKKGEVDAYIEPAWPIAPVRKD